MAFNSVLRRSASSLTPLAARFFSSQRTFSHHCGGALFTAVNRTPSITSTRSFLVPSVSRCSYSASPAVKRPSSDESLIRVIESEIKCSEDSYEEVCFFISFYFTYIILYLHVLFIYLLIIST